MSIENFLKKKSITLSHISGDDLDDFLEDKTLLLKRSKLVEHNRDFIFALHDNSVVGFAIFFNSENAMTPLKNVTSLSNIEVADDYQNLGIGTKILEETIKTLKNNNKILKRSHPTEKGETFIKQKFSEMLKKNDIPFIPHNLTFLYERLTENGFFEQKTPHDTMKILFEFNDKVLSHPKLKEMEIKELNLNFLKEADEVINDNKLKPVKNLGLKFKV